MVLSACNPVIDEITNSGPPPTACVITEPVAQPAVQQTKAVHVLVDRSPSFSHLTDDSLELVAGFVTVAASPGDRFVFGWISDDPNQPVETFFNEEVPFVTPPEIGDFPTPTPVVCGGLTTIQCQRARRAEVTELPVAICDLENQKREARTQLADWNQEQATLIETFHESARTTVNEQNPDHPPGTLITEALYRAGRSLEGFLIGGQQSAYLVIFSDLEESRSPTSPLGPLPLQLEGVDVIVAMFNCSGTQDVKDRVATEPQVCERHRTRWEPIFLSASAASVRFLTLEASTVSTLAELVSESDDV